MEESVPAQGQPPSLTILHHDEHLFFPGYDVMVGKGRKSQDEEGGPKFSTGPNTGGETDLSVRGHSSTSVSWYKKHKRKLIVAAIIWFAVFSLISSLQSIFYYILPFLLQPPVY